MTRRLSVWAVIVAVILMIPLLAQAPWTAGDFVFAGVVLYGCAAIYEFATKNIDNKVQRMAVGFAVATVLMLIWAWAVA